MGGGGGGFAQQPFGMDTNAFGGPQFQVSQQQGGDGGGFQVDNSTPDGKVKGKEAQSLIPATIKQLKNAPSNSGGDQGFSIDGKDLHQVTIVGIIMNAEEQNTNLQYTIDDGTDDIVVKMWIDAEADEAALERRAQWKEGKVVRVTGQLRSFNMARSIVAFNITPITDFNEYTFHFIEVVHTHLRNTKGNPPVAGMAGTSTGYGNANGMAAPAGGHVNQQPAQQASLQDTVLEFFQAYATGEAGSTITECFNAMKTNGASIKEIRETVDFLVGEGHLYSTIDDEHFKGT